MQRSLTILLISSLCLISTMTGLRADPLGEAEQALNARQYDKALPMFQQLAAKGEPGAMIGIWRMYQDGLGIPQNRDIALEWFSKGISIWNDRAKKNDPRAYASLGVLFNKGIGFQKDKGRARRYFRTAFDLAQPNTVQGDPDAQHLIGMLYSSGKGVPKDIFAGADWLSKSGEGGNEVAVKMLVHIFECGCRGLPKDDTKAEYWRSKLVAINKVTLP